MAPSISAGWHRENKGDRSSRPWINADARREIRVFRAKIDHIDTSRSERISCVTQSESIIDVMTRCVAILALLFAGLPPLGITGAARGEVAAPGSCCCCPANACTCGCEDPPTSQEDESREAPRFCGCDDMPVNLPPASLTVPQLGRTKPLAQLTSDQFEERTAIDSYSEHLPHGPPQVLDSLSTVILLT